LLHRTLHHYSDLALKSVHQPDPTASLRETRPSDFQEALLIHVDPSLAAEQA